eukprot:scaffold365996_cov23-Prasinocladus_malaysianus.AAC.1
MQFYGERDTKQPLGGAHITIIGRTSTLICGCPSTSCSTRHNVNRAPGKDTSTQNLCVAGSNTFSRKQPNGTSIICATLFAHDPSTSRSNEQCIG